MTKSLDRLYDLLPVVYRQRDELQGWPLRALLQVIAEQVNVVEDDIDQLDSNPAPRSRQHNPLSPP
jgi:hypothetical protein